MSLILPACPSRHGRSRRLGQPCGHAGWTYRQQALDDFTSESQTKSADRQGQLHHFSPTGLEDPVEAQGKQEKGREVERFIRLLVRGDFVVWWGKARGGADENEANKGTFGRLAPYSTAAEEVRKRTACTAGPSRPHHLLLAHGRCREKGAGARWAWHGRGYVPAKGLRMRMASCRNVLSARDRWFHAPGTETAVRLEQRRGTAAFLAQAGISRNWQWADRLVHIRQACCRSRVEPVKISKPGVRCAALHRRGHA